MLFNHLKFFSYYFCALVGMLTIVAGQQWIIIGFLCFMGFFVLGDAFFGDDLTTPDYPFPRLLTLALWVALPMSILVVLSGVWLTTSSTSWPMLTHAANAIPYDIVNAKQLTSYLQLSFAALFCGLMLGGVGTISAHELVHRVSDKTSVCIGRWILALSFDANFSIEHVYGHHRYVATEQDPATAPRGRSVYKHIAFSLWYGNKSAWHIESKRLKRKQQSNLSWHNTCLRGYGMSAVWLSAVYLLAGIQGTAFAVVAGLVAKSMLEVVNYMEHYGIVRLTKQRVMPRHSWNTNRRFSCWTMFNLSRHSHHHAQGAVPFQLLKPMPEAPTMINGYMATMLLTLIPPLWYKLMQPKLAEWDAHYANEQELSLIEQQTNNKHTQAGSSSLSHLLRPNQP